MFRRKKNHDLGPHFRDATDEIITDLQDHVLHPADEMRFVGLSGEVDRFWTDEMVDELYEEQRKHFEAKGESESRPAQVRAEALRAPAEAAQEESKRTEEIAAEAKQRYNAVLEALGKYRRRAPHDKPRYYGVTALLLGGDVTAVAGAAVIFGEIVWMAILMALASGTAAVTSGLLAAEIKDSRLARKRKKDPKGLTSEEKPFAHLLRGGDEGEKIVKYVLPGGLTISLLVFGTVLALRSTTEGTAAGLSYGCLATAIALASWVNTYFFTCEVSDLIDSYYADWRKAEKRLDKATHDKALRTHLLSLREAESIRRENAAKGEAAAHRIKAEGYGILVRSTGIAGHGRLRRVTEPRSQEREEEKRRKREPEHTASQNGSGR